MRSVLVVAWCLWAGGVVGAAEPTFRVHLLDRESAFTSAAAIDVNGDGRLDVVSGGWWYEAPTWKRHFVRDVEFIRGRFDDYSHLQLDVNGDGRIDLVSANYRSQSLYWVQNPGGPGPWTRHVVEVPGPMETARLYDVDGDGTLDVLPNGVQFAAWWRIERTNAAPGFRWVRHDLPKEIAGHGVGFGDINGDGRGDIVGPNGWLEAPVDRRVGPWRWHDTWRLGRDASIPILVFDVDGDGDNDVVWGRGHRIGLYWLEQKRDADGVAIWTRHAIDTSWSQAHSLLQADLDGDGHAELVAGKRYLGHEGRDPGEYDPLCIYAYRFDGSTRTWRRRQLMHGAALGFGLDPKAVDLDGDGDLDLVCSDRHGAGWLENLRLKPSADVAAGPAAVPPYANHRELLTVRDAAGTFQPVKTPFDWAWRREHLLREGLEVAMGPLPGPERRVPLDVQFVQSEPMSRYVRHRITFAAEVLGDGTIDRVPALLLIPRPALLPPAPEATAQASNAVRPGPAMLCLHQTTGIGKGEPAGLGGLRTLHYAHELAERGYVCLVPDYPSFGDYKFDFRRPPYVSGSMKAIWNNHRAVDLLESLPEVDGDRIGCIGHSLGGHNALFTAAFDQRLRAVVTSCGFTAFHHYYGGKLAGWTSDRYMPRIRDVYGNDPDRVPFDFYEILGSLAPRAVFINAPQRDANFDLTGVQKVVTAATEVYRLLEAAQQLRAVYPDSAHDFPDDVRQEAYEWLDGVLMNRPR